MNKFKKILPILTISLTLIGSLYNISFAEKAKSVSLERNFNEEISKDNIEKLRQELKDNDVSESDIEGLITKLENGEIFDCYKEEYNNLKPQIINESTEKTIYPDGSYVVTSTIPINTGIQPRAVYHSYGAEVKKSTPLVSASFKMDYSRDTTMHKAKVNGMYEIYVSTFFGTYNNLQYGYWPDWMNETHAWISFNFRASNNGAENRAWLKGFVNSHSSKPRVEYKY